jgi:hypothetical protein
MRRDSFRMATERKESLVAREGWETCQYVGACLEAGRTMVMGRVVEGRKLAAAEASDTAAVVAP